MLTIKLLPSKDVIKYLTETKGTVKPKQFLITVVTTQDPVLIESKENIHKVLLEETKGYTIEETTALLKFLYTIIAPKVMMDWEDDFILNIHYTQLSYNFSMAIADHLYGRLRPEEIDEDSYNNEVLFNVTEQYQSSIAKIHSLYQTHKMFDIDF